MTEKDKVQEFNKEVAAWGRYTGNQLKSNIRRLTHSDKSNLLKSLRFVTHRTYGEIDRVTFTFERHGIFVQHGVGRGYVRKNGIVIRGKKVRIGINRNDKRTDFKSISGIIRRRPKDWLTTTMNKNIEKLADSIGQNYADRSVNAALMRIK